MNHIELFVSGQRYKFCRKEKFKKGSELLKTSFPIFIRNYNQGLNPEILKEVVSMKMPFGKYKGTLLCNLPEYYLVWFQQKGFPQGKLGMLLSTMYEIKLNGLEYLLTPLKK